jgi:hypothetical protein
MFTITIETNTGVYGHSAHNDGPHHVQGRLLLCVISAQRWDPGDWEMQVYVLRHGCRQAGLQIQTEEVRESPRAEPERDGGIKATRSVKRELVSEARGRAAIQCELETEVRVRGNERKGGHWRWKPMQ